MKIRLRTLVAVAIAVYALAGSAAYCLDDWPTFRQNNQRSGLAIKDLAGTGVLGGFRPAPIWTFPAPDQASLTVDNLGTDFASAGTWTNNPLNAIGYFGTDYMYTESDPPSGTSQNTWATWTFTLNGLRANTASYYIYVWVPSPGIDERDATGTTVAHCMDAHYSVSINGVDYGTYLFDQTHGAGWSLLSFRSFPVKKGDVVVVKLTSQATPFTDESGNTIKTIVLADAVMLKMDTGIVLSSPVVSKSHPIVLTCRSETSFAAGLPTDAGRTVGAIYGLGTELDSGIGTTDDRGLVKWRFPDQDHNWIMGGISSSPALVYDGSGNYEYAAVPAHDGQVYVIDTSAAVGTVPTQIWCGPGYSVDEDAPGWTIIANALGCRGDSYSETKPVSTGKTGILAAAWNVSLGSSATQAHDIYAWIPPAPTGTNGHLFISDARYSVLDGSGDEIAGSAVKVFQGPGGYWAPILFDFTLPKGESTLRVKLTNETDENTDDTVGVVNYVAADAIRVLPAGLVTFEFSSPVVDSNQGIYVGSTSAGDTPSGRLYKLSTGSHEPVWVFPSADQPPIGGLDSSPALSPNESTVYIGSTDGHLYAVSASSGALRWAYPDLGATTLPLAQISSTPAVRVVGQTTYVYFGTGANWADPRIDPTEGKVYCLIDGGQDGPSLEWCYPDGTGGVSNLGAFLYASPMLMEQTFGSTNTRLLIGSTDGLLYTVDADATGGGKTTLRSKFGMGGSVKSSPAGTYVNFMTYGTPTTPGQARTVPSPMAFTGSGSRIYGIDFGLDHPGKDWWWDLMGEAWSSPAMAQNRIYIGDTEGYTWAFSTGTIAGAAEAWNPSLGLGPPTTGSEDISGAGLGRASHPLVDIFTKPEWEAFKRDVLEIAQHNSDSAKWFDKTQFETHARDYSATARPATPDSYKLEWGEDYYIVVWDLLDPNTKGKNDMHVWIPDPNNSNTLIRNPSLIREYPGKVTINVKSHAPGKASDAQEVITVSGSQMDWFTNRDAGDATQDNRTVFYSAYLYTLEGASGRSATPGSMFTISAIEQPGSPDMSSLEIPVPNNPTDTTTTPDQRVPQEFTINNPIGVVYSNAFGPPGNATWGTGTTPVSTIGVMSTGNPLSTFPQTKRSMRDSWVNGNSDLTQGAVQPPVIWGGYAPHNKLSDTRQIAICDRSLEYTAGRRINRFKVERHDLRWSGGPSQVVNGLPWDTAPGNLALNQPNDSDDYPDIDLRQIRTRMESNGEDPSQSGGVTLRAGQPTGGMPASGLPLPPVGNDTPWSAGPNLVNMAVQVPQHQPANVPMLGPNIPKPDLSTATPADLQSIGYTTYVYAYVDSNGNGQFDKPGGLGFNVAQAQKITGSHDEAYRTLEVQVHVPPDYRTQIAEQRLNIGEVPQGFGYTAGAGGVPRAFWPNLTYDSNYLRLAPGGFAEWYQPFTATNTGNVNLLDVDVLRTDMISDTVQQPIFDATGAMIPGSGFYIPASGNPWSGLYNPLYPPANIPQNGVAAPCVVSTLDAAGFDLGPGFISSVPPASSIVQTRTLRKAKVGESEPDLRIPDCPQSVAGNLNLVPQLPAVSVAVPLGTPAGTYHGRIQLGTVLPQGRQAISNPVDIVVTATESRLTGGSTLSGAPHLTHLDTTQLNASGQPVAMGSGMPATYRDPTTGDLLMVWSSSRVPSGTQPTASDPWYLYSTKLRIQGKINPYLDPWQLSTAAATPQWWSPVTSATEFPPATTASLNTFFPSPTPSDAAGAPGILMPGSVRFSSPSFAVDKAGRKAYLLFIGQAYKDNAAAGPVSSAQKTLESRAYCVEVANETIDPSAVYSTSPNATAMPIHGDWTTPKFGIRGQVMITPTSSAPLLWSFWYGGGNGKWRIYYNVKPDPSVIPDPAKPATQWTNEALLPVPKGLSSVAEPAPVVHWSDDTGAMQTGNQFEVVYSGVSTYHKNADIYLSRYQAAGAPDPAAKGGSWPVTLQLLAQRSTLIPEIVDSHGNPLLGEKLARDPVRGTWCSKDVDWLAGKISGSSADFKVFARGLDPADPTSVYQLNVGTATKDSGSGAIAFTYDDSSASARKLRGLVRAVVINPVDGTVSFMHPPVATALIVATYYPRAYRLTTDSVGDVSPCAVMDDDPNPRYSTNSSSGNPFYTPSVNGATTTGVAPSTDRLWVFWRRPTMDKPGNGVYYKAQRYMVQLHSQIELVANNGVYGPAIDSIDGVNGSLTKPVEIDWVKNRLYFTGGDGTDWLPDPNDPSPTPRLLPYQKQLIVTYRISVVDKDGKLAEQTVTEPCCVQYGDEDMSEPGKTFGNLTSLMVNEGQVSAFKDPNINRLWVFWSSTRSGNADLYYETISPRFTGREYR